MRCREPPRPARSPATKRRLIRLRASPRGARASVPSGSVAPHASTAVSAPPSHQQRHGQPARRSAVPRKRRRQRHAAASASCRLRAARHRDNLRTLRRRLSSNRPRPWWQHSVGRWAKREAQVRTQHQHCHLDRSRQFCAGWPGTRSLGGAGSIAGCSKALPGSVQGRRRPVVRLMRTAMQALLHRLHR